MPKIQLAHSSPCRSHNLHTTKTSNWIFFESRLTKKMQKKWTKKNETEMKRIMMPCTRKAHKPSKSAWFALSLARFMYLQKVVAGEVVQKASCHIYFQCWCNSDLSVRESIWLRCTHVRSKTTSTTMPKKKKKKQKKMPSSDEVWAVILFK